MILHRLVVALGAFLLFQIQPLIARYLLPWFGGTYSVWTTSMLFFQVTLLLGYAHAHLTATGLPARRQAWLHLTALAAAGGVLLWQTMVWNGPVLPALGWQSPGSGAPEWRLLVLLGLAVGVPFYVLATVSTTYQGWSARLWPSRSPYPLYAYSNLGSLLGLLSYPLIVEPWLGLRTQAVVWAVGFLIFTVLSGIAALSFARVDPRPVGISEAAVASPAGEDDRVSGPLRLLWLFLAAAGSILFLSTTNFLTQEIGSISGLWVVPLAIYLLSFIIAFGGRGYFRPLWLAAAPLAGLAIFSLGWRDITRIGVVEQVGLCFFGLLVGTTVCHGELYRLRPAPQRLSEYFLLVSAGGALGGVAIGVIAPLIFDSIKEFHFSCVLCAAAVIAATAVGKPSPFTGKHRYCWRCVAGLTLAGFCVGAILVESRQANDVLVRSRSFYGTIAVRKIGESNVAKTGASFPIHALYHGSTRHGFQARDLRYGRVPTSYYSTKSGLSAALQFHPKRDRGRAPAIPFKAGVIGLGIGTIATYGRTGETFRFYEISEDVVEMAQGAGSYFDYLAKSPAKVQIVVGDARISLRRELDAGGRGQQFDVLVLDAFNGDSLPLHLLTKEAFALYLAHMDSGGILAIHASSRYFAMEPVIARQLEEFGLAGVRILNTEVGDFDDPSEWILGSRSRSVIEQISRLAPHQAFSGQHRELHPWTDDRSNILQVVKAGAKLPFLTWFDRAR